MGIEFKRWQRYWKAALYSLYRKINTLKDKGMAALMELSPGYDRRTG
jgi:hypothetical protein